jgi:hypothetical protein
MVNNQNLLYKIDQIRILIYKVDNNLHHHINQLANKNNNYTIYQLFSNNNKWIIFIMTIIMEMEMVVIIT